MSSASPAHPWPRVSTGSRLHAGVPFAWVTADEPYGQAPYSRDWLHQRDAAYVLATNRNDTLTTTSGDKQRADELVRGGRRRWLRDDRDRAVPADSDGLRTLVIPSPPSVISSRSGGSASRT